MCIVLYFTNVFGVECYLISKYFQVKAGNNYYVLRMHALTSVCTHSRAYCHLRGAQGCCWRRGGAWWGTASFVLTLCWYRSWCSASLCKQAPPLMLYRMRHGPCARPLDPWIADIQLIRVCARTYLIRRKSCKSGRGLSLCTFVCADLVKVLSN